MSHLTLVRHGQASIDKLDYDQLSPLGHEQARQLGRFWASHDVSFDKVIVGTLKRHNETYTAVAEAYQQQGLHLPDPTFEAAFDEYDAFGMLQEAIPALLAEDDDLRQSIEAETNGQLSGLKGRAFWTVFTRAMKRWVKGEWQHSALPTWNDFKERVHQGIHHIQQASNGSERVVVFTSGGPISVAFGLSLSLTDEQCLETSWRIYNASLSTFLYTNKRFSLSQFNTLPHLTSTEQQTLR
jgi:broad specificity phosphatase PhoE